MLVGIYNSSCVSINGDENISFNKHVRPILNTHCVQCHGGVKQNADLSFLFRDLALRPAESGKRAIIPGRPGQSEMIARITHHDPELRMPLDEEPLSEYDVDILKKWIRGGAVWETHWAYQRPVEVGVPAVLSDWVKNDIDAFILQKLNESGLTPNEEADVHTLVRRASLDIIGLPPDIELIEALETNPSEINYEGIIDALLASPHFGERWATMWLDLARYADSKGYEKDNHREIWLYRDWVIDAFNADMPFDQFTIEQIAGDLLPNPRTNNYIATGFHRNTMNNSEGGVQNEEYRNAAVIDRVNTTWEVWSGTSFSCTQCHGHPYDPFKQEEYYAFMDFFNNTRDEDISDDSPNLFLYDPLEEERINALKNWIESIEPQGQNHDEDWAEEIENLLRITEPKIWSYHAEAISKTGTIGDDYILEGRHKGIAVFRDFPLFDTERFLVQCNSYQPDSKIIVRIDSSNGPVIGVWKLGEKGRKLEVFQLERIPGRRDVYLEFESELASKSDRDGVGNIFWILPNNAFKVFDGNHQKFREEFISILKGRKDQSPVLFENPLKLKRTTRVFDRGSWLTPMDTVHMNTPGSLPNSFDEYTNNRLGLAHWLVDGAHPLTSRVIVNRLWEQIFGNGIVLTLEDFGSQGEPPSHPELLDYLALRFQNEHEWSIKSFLKEILLSATYRQSSRSSSVKRDQDPYNRLLSRGPRFRLSAEQIRDQALSVSDLLSSRIKGPSVMPHLPPSAWNLVYPQFTKVHWSLSEGEDRYRRGLYTYWKRTSPYPAKMTFDVQGRDLCVSRRIRTNTPLQALVMLNDPVYVEAANALGHLMSREGKSDIAKGIQFGYKKALSRSPDPERLALLQELYGEAQLEYQDRNVLELSVANDRYADMGLKSPMAVVANAIINLDAFVTKE